MSQKTRRKSDLATIERISPNKGVPRTKPLRRLSPHCVAGNLSVESILGLPAFHDGKTASAGYAIGSDGRKGLGVEETNRPWTTSSSTNDNEAITFEIANNGGAPDWRMSDAAINAFLDMAVEICQFYGYKKVNYQSKPSTVARGTAATEAWIKTWAKSDEMIITLHTWYVNRSCPGPYFSRQLPWLVKEMNYRLQNPGRIPQAFVGEGGKQPNSGGPATTPATSQNAGKFKEYQVRIIASALNVRKSPDIKAAHVTTLVNDKNIYTIVGEADGAVDKKGTIGKFGKLKSGVGYIALMHTKKV